MSVSAPTLVFVPGAWHLPECFDGVREQLHNSGYKTVAHANPSFGGIAPLKNLTDDISSLQDYIESIIDNGSNVVVVTHSYGGVVGSGAADGLGLAQRTAAGKKGGIIMMVYMAAFALPLGVSLLDAAGGSPVSWWDYTDDGQLIYANDPVISNPAHVFYNDLPTKVANCWISKLVPITATDFAIPSVYEPWNDMPAFYIFTEHDNAIALAAQQGMAANMGNISTVSLNSSHSPFLSLPDKTAHAIIKAYAEGVAWASTI
ncbi:Alpha/beta hydrolase fold-1 [Leptodontidium sp. 2 PMI_412]|nr:Alpha/beta hydrolase fold-1 [Leptodontidium sp. 2 PMI_412]